LIRPSFATVVFATLIGTSLSGCAAAAEPTPVVYWAEARLHVVIKAIEPAENSDTWSVTFETEGEEMQAPTAPGMKRPLLVPGDTAMVLAKISQAGDLLITSITPDRPLERSPRTQVTPRP
jgi:hypothetical protein